MLHTVIIDIIENSHRLFRITVCHFNHAACVAENKAAVSIGQVHHPLYDRLSIFIRLAGGSLQLRDGKCSVSGKRYFIGGQIHQREKAVS